MEITSNINFINKINVVFTAVNKKYIFALSCCYLKPYIMKFIGILFSFLVFSINLNASVFSSSSKYYLENSKGQLVLWNLEKGEAVSTFDYKEKVFEHDKFSAESVSRILFLTHDGRYAFVRFNGTGKIYKKNTKIDIYATIDLQKGEMIKRRYSEVSRKFRPKKYIVSPNSYEYYELQIHSSEKYTASIRKYDLLSGNQSSMIIVDITQRSKSDRQPVIGSMFISEDGNKLLHTQPTGLKIYNTSNLEAKPRKISLKNYSIKQVDNELNTFAYSLDRNYSLYSSNLKLPKSPVWTKYDLESNEMIFRDNGKTLCVIQFNKYSKTAKKKLKVFDLEANKNLLEKEIGSNKDPIWFTPNGKMLLIKKEGKKQLYSTETGELIRVLESDDEHISKARFAFNKNKHEEALYALNNVSDQNNQEYLSLRWKVHGKLNQYKEAATHLAKVERRGEKAIKYEDAYVASTYLIKGGDVENGLFYLKRYQGYDIRKSAEQLEKDENFIAIRSNESFKKLVTDTKTIDDKSRADGMPEHNLFKNEIGLYELYIWKAYAILNNYKKIGLESALKQAKTQFGNAKRYASSLETKAKTHEMLGYACIKSGQSLDAVNEYEEALAIYPKVRYSYVELATAYLDIKSIIGESLQGKKQVTWPKDLSKDYSKVNIAASKLLKQYIKEFPNDPSGYYFKAMTEYSLDFDNYERRMSNAKKAIELFKKSGKAVPADANILADRTFGYRLKTTGANTNKKDCYSKCTSCGGRGMQLNYSQCSNCNGTGKSGSCYGCGGRGRKYDTTRNQQVCYTCSGSGKLTCYQCSGGRKSSHDTCKTCQGSGYHCD